MDDTESKEWNQRFTVRKGIVIEWGMEEDSRFVKSEYSDAHMFPSLGRDKQTSAVTQVGRAHV